MSHLVLLDVDSVCQVYFYYKWIECVLGLVFTRNRFSVSGLVFTCARKRAG